MSEKNTKPENLKFEEALERLETLVAKMESGKLPLENLIDDFETGSRLVAACRAKLDAMERRIELLTRDDGKNGQWVDFESESETETGSEPEAGEKRPDTEKAADSLF